MNPSFRALVFTRLFLILSSQIQGFLLLWQVFQATKDPLVLGFVGLTEAVATFALSMPAGLWVDRFNPKRAYIGVIFLVLATQGIGLTATTTPQFFFAAAIIGVARAFSSPSHQTLTYRLSHGKNLSQAFAWSTTALKLGSIFGPALAGLLVASHGARAAYGLGIGCALISFFCVSQVRLPKAPVSSMNSDEPGRSKNIWHELTEGFRFVFSDRILVAVMSLDLFAVFFGGVVQVLPFFADTILNVGPQGLGALRASPGIGALAVSLFLTKKPLKKGAGRILKVCVYGFGLSTMAFALSKSVILSCVLLAMTGGFDAISMVVRGAIIQLQCPEHLRGRVGSVNSIFITSSNELGAFESGIAAKFLGLIPSVIFGGGMTLASVFVAYKKVPELDEVNLS